MRLQPGPTRPLKKGQWTTGVYPACGSGEGKRALQVLDGSSDQAEIKASPPSNGAAAATTLGPEALTRLRHALATRKVSTTRSPSRSRGRTAQEQIRKQASQTARDMVAQAGQLRLSSACCRHRNDSVVPIFEAYRCATRRSGSGPRLADARVDRRPTACKRSGSSRAVPQEWDGDMIATQDAADRQAVLRDGSAENAASARRTARALATVG